MGPERQPVKPGLNVASFGPPRRGRSGGAGWGCGRVRVSYHNIAIETAKGGVGIVTLNRPAVLNALSFDLTRELDAALTAFEDDPEVRCVIITGAGEKAFSAGADIHEMAALNQAQLEARQKERAP